MEVATPFVANAELGAKLIISKRGGRVRRHHITPTVAAAVLMRDATVLLVSKGSGSGGDPALRADVTSSALFHSVGWEHHLVDIFALSDLGRILERVCLLDEEQIPVIVACLHYFGSSSPVLNVDVVEAVVADRTLRRPVKVAGLHSFRVVGVAKVVHGSHSEI